MVDINVWFILISMVLSVVLGFAWYGPLFGKTWMALSGIPMPEQKPGMDMMVRPIIISLIGAFFMTISLTYSIAYAGSFMGLAGASLGIQAGFWNWLGFIVPTQLSLVAWEGKSWKLFCIHAGYWLALLLLMGIVITL